MWCPHPLFSVSYCRRITPYTAPPPTLISWPAKPVNLLKPWPLVSPCFLLHDIKVDIPLTDVCACARHSQLLKLTVLLSTWVICCGLTRRLARGTWCNAPLPYLGAPKKGGGCKNEKKGGEKKIKKKERGRERSRKKIEGKTDKMPVLAPPVPILTSL